MQAMSVDFVYFSCLSQVTVCWLCLENTVSVDISNIWCEYAEVQARDLVSFVSDDWWTEQDGWLD